MGASPEGRSSPVTRTAPPVGWFHTVAFDFDGVVFDLVRVVSAAGLLCAESLILSKKRNAVVHAWASNLKLTCHTGAGDKLGFMGVTNFNTIKMWTAAP